MEIVIVGGGLAAANAARELRDAGHEDGITVVAAEPHLPYERPPLSKDVLLGKAATEDAVVLDQQWYDDHDVVVRTGTRATELDLDRGHVRVGDDVLTYDRLLLATGAQPRRLPGLDDAGVPVRYLRTMEDSDDILGRLGGHLLLVGAGWIGLEVASAARQAGGTVTIVDPAEQPLLAVLGPELAARFADLHRGEGVDLRLNTTVESAADGTVRLSDGTEVAPDAIVVGIGAVPDDTLAREAGLACDHGILVDDSLRCSDPHVFAAGDVANHQHPALGRRIRVEHWDTAIHQGRAAARVMLGEDAPYDRLPFFFTDQYDVGVEYVGAVGPDGYDEVVVRGDDLRSGLSALWLSEGTVVAGMHANDWDATDHLRRIVGGPAPAGVSDPGVTLADL
jgi:NADPH-dependent 2,4-dienoyl-CoA reductase/sulfur reductase-like enzyme